MASQYYVPGPSIIQVSGGGSSTLQFLGFCEDAVRISINGKFEPVRADYAGTMMPADLSFQGLEAYIMFDLARYNEAVCSLVANRLNVAGTEGAVAANTIGTLMFQEGFDFRLLIQCAYAGKTGFSSMIAAYNFLRTIPVDNCDVSLNTRNKKPRFVFHALPIISPTTLSGVLYNNSITGAVAAN